jgi:hypothetical protein
MRRRRVLWRVGLLVALVAAFVVAWSRPARTHETVTTTVLFDREIVRILNSHCVMCHVEGGPSFPLATYEQVWVDKRKISAAVIARRMPPWAAFSGYGRFANENVVTLRESQFIVSWMEGLGPRNAGKVFTNTADPSTPAPPPVRAHIDFNVWQVGPPELVRDLEPITVEPKRPDDVVRTVVDLGLKSEKRVRAVEYMPGDRRVVRAAFFTVQETGQWIGSWTPWYGFVKLPSTAAYRLPAGAHVAAEIHYRHTDQRVVDRGRLGLFFDTRTATLAVSDLVLEASATALPNTAATRVRSEHVLAADTDVIALRPELLAGIKSVEVAARRPDGGTDVLLFAKDIPLDWPTPYILARPLLLRRGTTLSATAYYANVAASPAPAKIRLTVSAIVRPQHR